MSISSISSSSINSLYQTGPTSGTGAQSTGEVKGGGHHHHGHGGGGLENALVQTLSQVLGASGTSTDNGGASTSSDAVTAATGSSDGTNSTNAQDVRAALGSFMHSLMGALHAQGGGQGDGDGDGARGPQGVGGPGGGGRMETDLQSLVAKLGSDTSVASTDASSDSSDSASSDLQSKFNNLLSVLGASTDDSGATLNKFLQTLQSNMQNVRPAGNAVNTTA